MTTRPLSTMVALALAAAAGSAGGVARAQRAPRAQMTEPVEVYVRIADQPRPRRLLLVGREGPSRLLYRPEGAPEGSTAGLNIETVRAAEFDITVDEQASYALARAGDFAGAAQRMLAGIRPALPYLDLPHNNAMDPALTAGRYLMRAAFTAQLAADAAGRERAPALYRAAYQVLRTAGRGEWHPRGETAQARAALALLRAGDPEGSARMIERMRRPIEGDGAFGAYWLARAYLDYERGEVRDALDAAIRSYLYENKDVEIMPEALLLAAQCYEDLLEVHRTRDVYYEVARLFRRTAWGELALRRLRTIMDEGLTDEEEPRDVAAVFFGREEDMNARVRELIEDVDAARRPAEDEDEDEDEGDDR